MNKCVVYMPQSKYFIYDYCYFSYSQVHYGFVLKTTDNNVTGGAYYMQKGIESMAEGTQDERFYFHLGDALQRQGKVDEAYKVRTDCWSMCAKRNLILYFVFLYIFLVS